MEKQSKGYEAMLIKLEAAVRNHIRVEQQLKLHIEQMQTQADELAKESGKKDREIEYLTKTMQKMDG